MLVGIGLSPRTVALYQRTITTAQEWFRAQGWDLATAGPEEIAAFLVTKPTTHATRNLLRAAFSHYWAEEVKRDDPPLRVCRALSEDDARILAKAARARGDRPGLAVILGMYQALRREEIATLRWDGIRDDGWVTVVGKGTKRRTIPLHPVTISALAGTEHGDEPWIFPGRHFTEHPNGHVSPATIWIWIREIADGVGVGLVKPHWLRHTSLATQNDNTGDLRTVQAFAGHSRPETTAGYTRATSKRLEASVLSINY